MHEGSEIEKEAGSADPRRSWSEKKETGKREGKLREVTFPSSWAAESGCDLRVRGCQSREDWSSITLAREQRLSPLKRKQMSMIDPSRDAWDGKRRARRDVRRERGRERQEGSGGEAVEKASVKETGGVKLETSDSKKQTEGKGKRGEARGSREERAKASTGVREREGEGKRRGEREDAMRVLIK